MTNDPSSNKTGAPTIRRENGIAIFNDRTLAINVRLFSGVFVITQGLLTILYFRAYPEDIDAVRWFVVMGLSIVAICSGFYLAIYAFKRMHDHRPPIMIGPAGLHDRSVSERAIAWRDVADVRWRSGGRGGPYIEFEIQPGSENRAGIWPARRRMASLARRFGYLGYRIHHTGTDATPDSLMAAVNVYFRVRR